MATITRSARGFVVSLSPRDHRTQVQVRSDGKAPGGHHRGRPGVDPDHGGTGPPRRAPAAIRQEPDVGLTGRSIAAENAEGASGGAPGARLAPSGRGPPGGARSLRTRIL